MSPCPGCGMTEGHLRLGEIFCEYAGPSSQLFDTEGQLTGWPDEEEE